MACNFLTLLRSCVLSKRAKTEAMKLLSLPQLSPHTHTCTPPYTFPIFPFPPLTNPNQARSLVPWSFPSAPAPHQLYSHCTARWSTLPWWCTGRQSAQQKGCYQTGWSHHWGQSSPGIHNQLGSPARHMGEEGQILLEYLQTHLEGGG